MKKQTVLVPGTVLKEKYLDVYQLSPGKLAEDIGLSASAVRNVLINKAKISLNVAVRLSKYFGTTVQYWVDLQNAYDLVEIANDAELNEAVKKIQRAKKPAPVKKPAASAGGKKGPVKKDAAKKPAAKKPAVKKAVAKKPVAKKAAPKKLTPKSKKPLLKKD
jgi:addiction module HigA family antidote